MTRLVAVLLGLIAALLSGPALAAEPKTCSEAYTECVQRRCDSGCVSTCRIRLHGCLKTGAFASQRQIRQNLKKN